MSGEELKNITEEAASLRNSLKSGMINTVKLDNFLSRVIKLKDPVIRERITKQRYRNQLVRLNENVN